MPKPTATTAEIGLFDGAILRRAAGQAVLKLNPRGLARNPVIFVTGLTAALVTILVARDGLIGAPTFGIGLQVAIWLWFTVLFANFAEAVAEGAGLGLLPCFIAQTFPNLVPLSEPKQEFSGSLWLLTHPDLRNTARVRVFMDHVAAEIGKRRPEIEGQRADGQKGASQKDLG